MNAPLLDRELVDLPPDLRRREWMLRVEALIFASDRPVPRQALAPLIGALVPVEEIIALLQEELRARPYELVYAAGGWQLVTRERYGTMLRAHFGGAANPVADLSKRDTELLAVIAFQQPLTRREAEQVLGRAVSGEDVGRLRALGLIVAGHRRPGPGSPATLVTTDRFLEVFGLGSLDDLAATAEDERCASSR